jgi:hypothetical protein
LVDCPPPSSFTIEIISLFSNSGVYKTGVVFKSEITVRMSPIHRGITLGRRVAELHRLARKVKKRLLATDFLVTIVIDALLTELETYGDSIENPKNASAENGDIDTFIHKNQIILIEQLLRKPPAI